MIEDKFSVIIVSWNVKSELDHCLSSLEREVGVGVYFKTIVVDNASADNTVDMVQQKYPWVNLMALQENVGFAKACNLAVNQAESDYIVLLNPDTEVVAGFFSDLERFFIHHHKAAIVGGHILNIDGSTQASVRTFPGLWVGLLEATKLLGRWPGLAPSYLLPKFNYTETQVVDQVMGACLAIRSSVWQQLGGFDEQFFVWFEEVDLCRRAQQFGYEIWYDAHINLVHHRGKSFVQLPAISRHRLFITSLVRYLKKHHSNLTAGLVWLISRPALIIIYLYDLLFEKKS